MFITFYNEIFNINLSDYENIGINFPINKVLLALTLTLCAACVAFELQRMYTKDLVRKMIRREAFSVDSGVTLSDIGFNNVITRWILTSDTSFVARLVKRVGAVEYTYDEYVSLQKAKKLKREKIDFATARFYLDSTQEKRRNHIMQNYNSSVLRIIMMCALMLVVYGCVAILVPEILSIINDSLVNNI